MAKSPVAIPFSTDGVEIGVTDGLAIPANQRGFISVGYDGTNLRFLRSNSSGQLIVVGAGTAGTPAGGVVSVQGVSGGQALPISVASLPLPSGAATEATLATLLTEATFTARINTLGQKTMSASTPIVIASDQSAIPASQSGTWTVQQGTPPWQVVGPGAAGAAITGNPVIAGGSDGTNARYILVDSSGRQITVGAAASGAAVAGNPVLVGGSDGTNARTIRTLSDGTVQTRYKELASFTILATNIQIGNNKSMLSIVNATGSTVVARLLAIYLVNVQVSSVTGVEGIFELRRITGHSSGTSITAIETLDTSDTLDTHITARTNGTVSGESATLLWRNYWSTDDWGTGHLDTESMDHAFQSMFPIWRKPDPDSKPIKLRAGEGLTVKFATNNTHGTFDVMVILAQE